MKHRITWYTVDKIIKKVIDFSILDTLLRQFVTAVRIYNLYFESDHRCLVTKLITPANNAYANQKISLNITAKLLKMIM